MYNLNKNLIQKIILVIHKIPPIILILFGGLYLRFLFFTGITGSRDEYLELMGALHFHEKFSSFYVQRIAIGIPKFLLFKFAGINEFTSMIYPFTCSVLLIYLVYAIASK